MNEEEEKFAVENIMDSIEQIVEGITGFRNSLIANGFSKEAAERLTVILFGTLGNN